MSRRNTVYKVSEERKMEHLQQSKKRRMYGCGVETVIDEVAKKVPGKGHR